MLPLHSASTSRRCSSAVYFGVDLFFLLSGFLLSTPFHRAALAGNPWPSLKQFWIHRCRRVLPAYWLPLLILTALFLSVGRSAQTTAQILIAHALLIQNVVPWPVPLLNPVYWSTSVEWSSGRSCAAASSHPTISRCARYD